MADNSAVLESTESVDETVAVAEGGETEAVKLSPKAKSELGIAEDQVITWLPFASDAETNTLIRRVAKARKAKVYDVVLEVLKANLDSARAGWEAEAAQIPAPAAKAAKAKALPTDPVEAEKVLAEMETKAIARAEKAQKAADNARKALEMARQRQADRASGVAPATE